MVRFAAIFAAPGALLGCSASTVREALERVLGATPEITPPYPTSALDWGPERVPHELTNHALLASRLVHQIT